MVALYGPAETLVPGGTPGGGNFLLTRAFDPNDVIHFGFASATADAGVARTDWDFTVDPGTVATFDHIINRNCLWSETNVSFSYTVPHAQTILVRVLGGGFPANSSHGTAHGLFISYDPAVVVHCEHGTEITPGGAGLVQLTPALIEAILTSAGFPELGFFFIPLYWSMFSTETLCDDLPPPLPTVDLLDPTISFQTRLDIFRAISWLSFCRCVPGTPTPVPPPPPAIVVPPGTPTAPVFPCDNVDPCAALVAIQQQLAALSSAMASTSQLVTLLQRYSEPFAYIPGAVHSGIHVSGSFAVSRLVGMRVTVVERPGGERLFSGVPNYISDLGWMSVLTGDGLIDEIRLTRDTQSWFPKLMPLATQFGISLRDGVVVDLQELEAEP